MEWTDRVLRGHLKGCRILIVEDDSDLAPRLKRWFMGWGIEDEDVVICRCVEGESQGALDLLKVDDEFDLICLDIMLPWTEAKLNLGDQLQSEWEELQQSAAERSQERKELVPLRSKLDQLSEQMRGLIDREAGLRMVHEWFSILSEGQSSKQERKASPIPILFFSSREEDGVCEQVGKPTPENCLWLPKPVRERHLMETAARLISAQRRTSYSTEG